MASQRNTIMQYLETTLLANITTGNGYHFTLRTKERGLKHYQNLNDEEFPAIFISSGDESRENISNRHFKSTLLVFFVGYVKAATDTSVQEELDHLIADLTKALYDGPTVGANDPTHGGRVTWTDVKQILTDEGDLLPHAMFKMQVDFGYVQAGIAP